MESQKRDIYSEALKTIVGYYKRSLLDFIDAFENAGQSNIRTVLGRIKGRVHNDLSQCQLSLGILLATMRSGGDIQPFEDNLIFRKTDDDRPRGNRKGPQNPVLSEKEANGIKSKL